MASPRTEDILLPSAAEAVVGGPARTRIAAFVPIAIAIIGVAAILVGRVTVQEIAASDVLEVVDPIATGSIEGAAPAGLHDTAAR